MNLFETMAINATRNLPRASLNTDLVYLLKRGYDIDNICLFIKKHTGKSCTYRIENNFLTVWLAGIQIFNGLMP